MAALAIIEDEQVVNDHFRDILRGALPNATIEQILKREHAEACIREKRYDLILLDIELGSDKLAGIGLIHELHKRANTPVLVISGAPAELHRPIMLQLEAWDYLQKPVEDRELVDTVLEILKETMGTPTFGSENDGTADLVIDPVKMKHVIWKGKKASIPITGQRILAELYRHRGSVVSYKALFELVVSGKNPANIRKQVSNIRRELVAVDPEFDRIHPVPMTGFVWQDPD